MKSSLCMPSGYRMLSVWNNKLLFWMLQDKKWTIVNLVGIESFLELFLCLRLFHLERLKSTKNFFTSFAVLQKMHYVVNVISPCSAFWPAGVVRQLRRIDTWSRRTRKSTSRSWRRTTAAWERTWGLCWRGRFLSSINPSSGLVWRTGKQTHQVKQPILFW